LSHFSFSSSSLFFSTGSHSFKDLACSVSTFFFFFFMGSSANSEFTISLSFGESARLTAPTVKVKI